MYSISLKSTSSSSPNGSMHWVSRYYSNRQVLHPITANIRSSYSFTRSLANTSPVMHTECVLGCLFSLSLLRQRWFSHNPSEGKNTVIEVILVIL